MQKQNWIYKKIKDVCEKASSNIVLNKIENNVGDYALYGASGFVKGVDFFHREEPYIGIVKDGSGVGRVDVFPAKSSLVGTMQYILPKKDCLLKYLCYALQSLKLADFVTGAAIPHIYFRDYGECVIPVPPLAIQSRIVSELDLLQSIIDKQKAQLKDLDNLAQAIFYDMFGDPVENEKGWEVKKVSAVTKYFNGIAHEQDVDENGSFILINAKYISTQGEIVKRTTVQRFPLFVNDIVMVLSDLPNGKSLGKCFLVDKNNLYSLNQRICCFRGFNGVPMFLKFVINRNPYLLSFDDGKGQTNLRKNDVENLPVILPPLSFQQSFAQKIESIERQKELINQSIREAQTLFDSRMEYYFGE